MNRPRALDLFCCAGGASEGLFRAGFHVTGVDIVDQPHYPFPIHKADAMTFPLDGYDFIWASPPCQRYTNAQRIQRNDHPDYVAAIRARLKASGIPYCIENVPGAPLEKPVILCGRMFGLELYRHRLFECSFPVEQPWHSSHDRPQTKMGRPPKDGEIMQVVGNFSGVEQAKLAMGIHWMVRDELREAIPPAYAEHIGRAAMAHIRQQEVNDKIFERRPMVSYRFAGGNIRFRQYAKDPLPKWAVDVSNESDEVVSAKAGAA